MAKLTYSIGGLDFGTLQRVDAFLQGAPAAPAGAPPPPPAAAPLAPPAPMAPAAPPAPPMMTAPLVPPAMPAPAPVVPQQPAAPAPAGAKTQMDVITAMQRVVGLPGGAGKVSAIVARYNATQPGVPGPVSVVAPEQYANIIAEFDAIAG